jgi:tRNA splicing endonuclease
VWIFNVWVCVFEDFVMRGRVFVDFLKFGCMFVRYSKVLVCVCV